MIVLGIILLIVGWLIPTTVLVTQLGIVLIIIGVILEILGAVGRPVAGRRHYW